MIVNDHIPASLIGELWSWHESLEGVERVYKWEVQAVDEDVDFKRRFTSLSELEKGSAPLRTLKSVQRMIQSLSEVVDNCIRDAQRAVIPASRFFGLPMLPHETVVRIIELAGQHLLDRPHDLQDWMWGLFDIPYLDDRVKDAKLLLNRCKTARDVIRGPLPMSGNVLAKEFLLTEDRSNSLREVTLAFRDFACLRRLEISATFDYQTLEKDLGDDDAVSLPYLQWLSLKNGERKSLIGDDARNKAIRPLQTILKKLNTPNLRHVLAEFYDPAPDVNSQDIVNAILNLQTRKYPNVTALELNEIAFGPEAKDQCISMEDIFNNMPALTALTLGSCDIVDYNAEWTEDLTARQLRFLRLEYGPNRGAGQKSITPRHCQLLVDLLTVDAPLEEVLVVASDDDDFKIVQRVYPSALRVTDKSILYESDDEWDSDEDDDSDFEISEDEEDDDDEDEDSESSGEGEGDDDEGQEEQDVID